MNLKKYSTCAFCRSNLNLPDERTVLEVEGLSDWKVKDGVDGYCWKDDKVIQRIPEDFALFLHEVAHALCERVNGDQHHGIWAAQYTRLVRKYLCD